MKLNHLTKNLAPNWTYNIGFVNSDGRVDETQFDVTEHPSEELEECWIDFCKSEKCNQDSVLYVEPVERYYEEE